MKFLDANPFFLMAFDITEEEARQSPIYNQMLTKDRLWCPAPGQGLVLPVPAVLELTFL